MKLLICLITHNRLSYTQKTLKLLRDNTSDGADYYLIVADNASSDGTQEYLKGLHRRVMINGLLFNKDNLYPGAACNQGWEIGLKDYDPTHLMRLDNDMQLERDWDLRVAQYFKSIPELGQLGLDHEAIEHPSADLRRRTVNGMTINEWPGCVGGPSIIPRKIWEMGIRWPDLRWDDKRKSPSQEDSAFSKAIMDKGFLVGHAQEEVARTFANRSNWAEHKDYYLKTMRERGYDENVKYLETLK